MGVGGAVSSRDPVRIFLWCRVIGNLTFLSVGLHNKQSLRGPPWGTILLRHFHVTLSPHRMATASL